MKKGPICILVLAVAVMLLFGCGGDGGSGSGGGGSSPGTGTVSLDIADAKPFIAGEQPDELWLVFQEVRIHKSGGGWVSMDLPYTPLEINLLAFSDGQTTQLVTPTLVTTGHITQIRLVISRAYMVFYGNPQEIVEIDLDVPSGFLRTDKQCDWWMEDGWALDYTVHFDLSKSIVETGGGEYKLKPVIHLFDNNPQEAARIYGNIDSGSFVGGPPEDVVITVIWNGSESETYTKITVARGSKTEATRFCVFWLVPLALNESYTVQIDNGVDSYEETVEHTVEYPELGPGDSFDLNNGDNIEILTN